MTAAHLYPPMQIEDLEHRIRMLETLDRSHAAERAAYQADRLHLEIERGVRQAGREELEARLSALETRGPPTETSADADEQAQRRVFEVELLHDLSHRMEGLEQRERERASDYDPRQLRAELDALQGRADAIEARERARDAADGEAGRRRHAQELAAMERRTTTLDAREKAHAVEALALQAERRELEAALKTLYSQFTQHRPGDGDVLPAASEGRA